MTNIEIVDLLTEKMMEFDKGDARRIQHFLKVHRFAQLIGRREKLEEHTQLLLECAAVVHDVGIHPAEAEYGYNNGKLQEKFGPEYGCRRRISNASATSSVITIPIAASMVLIIRYSSRPISS